MSFLKKIITNLDTDLFGAYRKYWGNYSITSNVMRKMTYRKT